MACPKANGFNDGEHNICMAGICAYCGWRVHEPKMWTRARPNRNERRRIQLRRRDGNCCMYCRREFGDRLLATIDHVKPRSKGGSDHIDNLVLACHSCNSRKADSIVPLFAYLPVAVASA